MNKLLVILLVFMGFNAYGQKYVDILKSEDYALISNHMDENVSFGINGKQDRLTKSSAINQLKAFFQEFQPTEWEEMHRGSSSSKQARYVVTRMTNQEGKSYRLFMVLSKDEKERKITSIRLRKQS